MENEIARTALEQSMLNAVTNLGLVNLSIDFNRYPDDLDHTWFNVSAQWLEPSGLHGRGIATATSDTIEGALAAMMKSLASKRAATIIDTSEALEVAA